MQHLTLTQLIKMSEMLSAYLAAEEKRAEDILNKMKEVI